MLTIREPIQMKTNRGICMLRNDFQERITGNYQLLAAHLEAEDMLHFITEPPEVYLAEGSMTSLVQNNKVYENQNLKFEVVNNVLNRILLSDSFQMTYQDQVFIESVLRKIGITDVQNFLQQVQDSKEEIKNVHALTSLYTDQRENLTQLMKYYTRQEEAKGEKKQQETEQKKSEYWLHQNIFQRLKTGDIYEKIQKYVTASQQNSRFSQMEMQISEQNITAQNLRLNELRNQTMFEAQPLVYQYMNSYELVGELPEQRKEQKVTESMIGAVLLNAIHQMYALRTEELLSKKDVWYQLAQHISQVTENTMQRFEAYHTDSHFNEQSVRQYSEQVRQYQKKELQAIRLLQQETNNEQSFNQLHQQFEQTQLTYLTNESESGQERENSEGEPAIEQVTHTSEVHGQQIQSITKQEQLLKNRLEQVNQNNIRNLQLLSQFTSETGQEASTERINRDRAKQDALKALTEPEEILLNYLERETTVEKQKETEHERLKQVFGEDTLKIFETIKKYQENPRYMEQMSHSGQPEAMLLRDIAIEQQESYAELVHRTDRTEHELIDEQTENETLRSYLPIHHKTIRQETIQKEVEQLQLVHKQEETQISEEMIEELRRIQNVTKVENEQSTQTVTETNKAQETVNTRIYDYQKTQNEELMRLLSEQVQTQLGGLSEQIYTKLEKRMDAERRRRGL